MASRITLRWYESWIVRTAALSALILLCGYVASVLIAVQGIDSVARIAHDGDIEEALSNNSRMIKEAHQLRKENFVGRLHDTIPEAVRRRPQLMTDENLQRWLAEAVPTDRQAQDPDRHAQLAAGERRASPSPFIDTANATIKTYRTEELAEFAKNNIAPIYWLDQETLRVYDRQVVFPKSRSFEDFQNAQSLYQRYQLIGVTLEKEIRPALIRANSLILAVTFILLVGAFLVLARRFKQAIERVLTGFIHWSETNPQFRFGDKWRGELKLITAQFNAMADDVEANRKKNLYLEKIASWQTIARKLAHEIKNPLTPIQMMVSQLTRRYRGDDEEYRKLLENAQTIISEEVDGLRRMVDNFSEFARLPLPKFVPTDLVGVLSRVVDLEKAAFEHHDIAFATALTSAPAAVDEDLLRQVIINLVKNAAEACGDTPAVIRVGLEHEANYYRISVEDNGPGIPGELQGDIFEAYFTTKHTGPSPGMGLGLAVCQKIVLDHEGELIVKSQPGKTLFIIRLPKRLKGLPDVV